jgi:hypothetical protein
MPLLIGAIRPIAAFVATAASIAFPPCSSTSAPMREARECSVATIPNWEITIERACERSCAVAESMAASSHPIAQRAAFENRSITPSSLSCRRRRPAAWLGCNAPSLLGRHGSETASVLSQKFLANLVQL